MLCTLGFKSQSHRSPFGLAYGAISVTAAWLHYLPSTLTGTFVYPYVTNLLVSRCLPVRHVYFHHAAISEWYLGNLLCKFLKTTDGLRRVTSGVSLLTSSIVVAVLVPALRSEMLTPQNLLSLSQRSHRQKYRCKNRKIGIKQLNWKMKPCIVKHSWAHLSS